MDAIEQLQKINTGIRDAEWNRDIEFMQKILDEELVFQRANGSFADKNTYIAGLADPDNTFDYLEQAVDKINLNESGNKAIAVSIVKASGKRGKDHVPFNGEFKNIRFFNNKGEWKLYAWYNEAVRTGVKYIPNGHIVYKESTDNTICGKAFEEDSPQSLASPHTRARYVKFENGSFTKWHWHCGVQILLVTEGIGFVEYKGFPPFEIKPGDRIYIPEYVTHRHGAKESQTLVHLAVTNGKTEWDKEDSCE